MPTSRANPLPGSRVRTKVVWCTLAAAMTVGVGLLSLLDPGSPTRTGGMSLSPLMATGGARGVEAVLNTRSPIEDGRWHTIVLVHSGTPTGSAARSRRATGASATTGWGSTLSWATGRGCRTDRSMWGIAGWTSLTGPNSPG